MRRIRLSAANVRRWTVRSLVAGALAGWSLAAVHEWRRRLRRVVGSVAEHENYWRHRPKCTDDSAHVLLGVLGDSLAQGIGADHPEHGFVGLFAARWGSALGAGVRVLNFARTGVGVDHVLSEQLPRLEEHQPDLVIVAVGTNDVSQRSSAEFAANLKALCARLPGGSLVGDIPDFRRGPQQLQAQALCATARQVIAEHPNLIPVDMHRASAAMRPWEFAADLAHPGNAGHRRYADAFWAAYRYGGSADHSASSSR